MFDLPLQSQPKTHPAGLPPRFPTAGVDHGLAFALTMPSRAPSVMMTGQARPEVLERFAKLVDAMQGAIDHAEHFAPEDTPQILAILDRDERLILAGAASEGAMAWCHPVANAAEARAVVSEASQTRAQAIRAAEWQEPDLAQRLRHRADLLDGRLVDPLWRAFAAAALRIAA